MKKTTLAALAFLCMAVTAQANDTVYYVDQTWVPAQGGMNNSWPYYRTADAGTYNYNASMFNVDPLGVRGYYGAFRGFTYGPYVETPTSALYNNPDVADQLKWVYNYFFDKNLDIYSLVGSDATRALEGDGPLTPITADNVLAITGDDYMQVRTIAIQSLTWLITDGVQPNLDTVTMNWGDGGRGSYLGSIIAENIYQQLGIDPLTPNNQNPKYLDNPLKKAYDSAVALSATTGACTPQALTARLASLLFLGAQYEPNASPLLVPQPAEFCPVVAHMSGDAWGGWVTDTKLFPMGNKNPVPEDGVFRVPQDSNWAMAIQFDGSSDKTVDLVANQSSVVGKVTLHNNGNSSITVSYNLYLGNTIGAIQCGAYSTVASIPNPGKLTPKGAIIKGNVVTIPYNGGTVFVAAHANLI